MNELAVFNFEQLPVRVVMINGEPWFVAKDVAAILGYSNTKQAILDHCKYAKSLKDIGVTNRDPEQNQLIAELDPQTKLIPESDVYRLAMRSKLPTAERFERWVMEELLPQLRKNRMYQLTPQSHDQSIAVRLENQLLTIGKQQQEMFAVMQAQQQEMKQEMQDQLTEIKTEISTLKTRMSEGVQDFPDEAMFRSRFIKHLFAMLGKLHEGQHLTQEQLKKIFEVIENYLEKQQQAKKKTGYTTQEKADLKRAALILQDDFKRSPLEIAAKFIANSKRNRTFS